MKTPSLSRNVPRPVRQAQDPDQGACRRSMLVGIAGLAKGPRSGPGWRRCAALMAWFAQGWGLVGAGWLVFVLGLSLSAQDPRPPSLVDAARSQIGKTVQYDPSYRKLTYPNGDVPMEVGVCTDVVVRALRLSVGLDLQRAVHEDMRTNFAKYPTKWGLKVPDPNIDHRRVLNLQTYFERRGWSVPVTDKPADYRAGDLVTCTVGRSLPHIMIVSDRSTVRGVPLILHNIGSGTQEEDRLFEFRVTGHYRVKGEGPATKP